MLPLTFVYMFLFKHLASIALGLCQERNYQVTLTY